MEAQRRRGGLAQLEEHLLCKQGVTGSSPITSTMRLDQSVQREWLSTLIWPGWPEAGTLKTEQCRMKYDEASNRGQLTAMLWNK